MKGPHFEDLSSVDNIKPVLSHGAPRPRLFPPCHSSSLGTEQVGLIPDVSAKVNLFNGWRLIKCLNRK